MFNFKTHPVATMIGGAILAAWIPFWTFASTLSTMDFFRTSSGHAGIGSFFLPRGIADGLTVIGIAVMVYAFVGSEWRKERHPLEISQRPTPAPAPAELPLSRSETLLLNRADSEMGSLTWAQQTGLCLIYGRAPLHLGELKSQLENLGFANVGDQIIDPLKKTTLVAFDMQNIRIGPSHHPIIARHVEGWTRSLTRI